MKPLLLTLKQGSMNGNGRPSAAATYGVFGLLAIIIMGFFGLAFFGREIGSIVTVMGPIVVVLIGLVPVIAGQSKIREQTDATHEKLETIESNTNGKLDKKFEALNRRLDDMIGKPEQVHIRRPLTDEELGEDFPDDTAR